MHRKSVIRRTLVAAAAVTSLAFATGCSSDAIGAGGSSSKGGSSSAPSSPSSDSKPQGKQDDKAGDKAGESGEGASRSPEADAGLRVLMKEGTENEQVRELQARLRQIDYFHRSPTAFYGSKTSQAVKEFQTKRGLPATGNTDETTWTRLLAMTKKPTTDQLRPPTTNEPDKPDARCMTGRVLCISKESRTLLWMVDGKQVSAMDVRFGSENTPTREGTFKVDSKSRDHVSTIYHTPMPYAMFFSGGQAVHYSSDFAARGYNGASHGCVNVRDKERISQLFDQVKVGDKVVVHW